MVAKQLNRSAADPAVNRPVRIVHLGLGAFHRAHQAWYTQQASDGEQWGIAAFTGRRPHAAAVLASQGGVYTLITRSGEGDTFELMTNVVQAHDGADGAAMAALISAPATALVTLTITEAAYNLTSDGCLDTANPAVLADIAVLRTYRATTPCAPHGHPGAGSFASHSAELPVWASTAPGRLVQALDARRRAGTGPLAVVSCDNLANNGPAARAAVVQLAAAADTCLAAWIDKNVSFVGTSIDRITPRSTLADTALVERECGYHDAAPVVTEPFSSWVLCGVFPAGRPDWESAGAVFVDDIEPFENRKLWLLNGAHSLLAYAGQLRGHETVAQALADPSCAHWVDELWDCAAHLLPAQELGLAAYRAALLERFANPRIAHHLTQIGRDGASKLRMRVVPVVKAERRAGRTGLGALRLVAAWVAFLQDRHDAGLRADDAAAGQLAAALAGADPVSGLLAILDEGLLLDGGIVHSVAELAEQFRTGPAPHPTQNKGPLS